MGADLQAKVRAVLAGPVKAPASTLTTDTILGTFQTEVIGLGGDAAITVTIEAPRPGGPGIGDDGRKLIFIVVTEQNHVITGPANCINQNKSTATAS